MNAPLATEVEKTPILTAGGGTHIVLPGQTPEGGNILGVLLKRTYRIVPGGVCVRADADNDLIPGDVFWDSPMNSSVRFESDFIPFKLATDFVINGTAFAPNGKATSKCVVSIQVADRRKQLSVIGDRVAHYIKDGMPVFSDPVPFETMELKYERAYGGTYGADHARSPHADLSRWPHHRRDHPLQVGHRHQGKESRRQGVRDRPRQALGCRQSVRRWAGGSSCQKNKGAFITLRS